MGELLRRECKAVVVLDTYLAYYESEAHVTS